ncbi:A24 family peptidase [Roseibium aggregatum]|uniref:Peptidase n=1 Tax=Roseibium aggregatum TaxID=187304 RepID=A0A926P1K9_9HYPH|nr:prepilin peptidase [Roseibium aggregatum]MBD1544757.1 peptidase [Roseibium aggregatum]
MIENIQLIVFPILVAFAGASDLFTMKIPNRVSILLVAGFVILAIALGLSPEQWGWHLAGGGIVFVACFAMFFLGWMGGGDAKLASAIALWFGFNETLLVFLTMVAIYGMFLTVGLLAFRTLPVLPGPLFRQDWIARLHDRKTGIPYGIAIAAAGLQVYPSTFWFPALH